MKSLFIAETFTYDGSQLSQQFAYKKYALLGNSIVSWVGPCDIQNEFMKDGEDLLAGEKIYSEEMLHFIIELFDVRLLSMVAIQRLFSAQLLELLRELKAGLVAYRKGDDIYIDENLKLNISIASVGVMSGMIHCGVNVSSKNTPVPTMSLKDLGLDPKKLALTMMERFSKEYQTMIEATQKVFALT